MRLYENRIVVIEQVGDTTPDRFICGPSVETLRALVPIDHLVVEVANDNRIPSAIQK